MNDTSLTLLNRLRDSSDSESWDRLVQLYAPLIRNWLRKFDVQASDADDLTQEVLLSVFKDLGKFEHAGHSGAFRGWLRAILVNKLRNSWRTRDRKPPAAGGSRMNQMLAQLDDPASELSLLWNQEHDQHVLGEILSLVKPHFEEQTWTAFSKVALEGHRADNVAQELGISLNAVFVAKSRVLSRLRHEADGLVQSSFSFPPSA